MNLNISKNRYKKKRIGDTSKLLILCRVKQQKKKKGFYNTIQNIIKAQSMKPIGLPKIKSIFHSILYFPGIGLPFFPNREKPTGKI